MTTRVTSDPGSDVNDLERLLLQAPSFQKLDPAARSEMAESMAKVAHFLSADGEGRRAPLAGQLAPDLREQLSPNFQNASSTPTPAPRP